MRLANGQFRCGCKAGLARLSTRGVAAPVASRSNDRDWIDNDRPLYTPTFRSFPGFEPLARSFPLPTRLALTPYLQIVLLRL